MKKNYFLRCIYRYGGYFLLLILLSYLLTSIVVTGNDIIAEVVDTMLTGEKVAFGSFLTFFLVLTVSGFVIAFFQSLSTSYFSLKVQTRYKNLVAQKLYHLEYKYFDENGTASVINKMNADIAEADYLLNETLPNITKDMIEIVVYAIYIGSLNWKLLLFMLAAYPLVLWFTNYVAQKITNLKHVFREKTDTITGIAQDCVSGILALRSFGAEKYFQKKLDQAAWELVDNEGKRTRISNTSLIIRKLLQWIPNIACAVYAYVLVRQGSLSVGELLAFIIILDRFVNAFVGLPFDIVDAREHAVCVKRVESILRGTDETYGVETTGMELADAIVFENVGFQYNEGGKVLENLTFRVPRGSSVAFVGESGGGKSTIFHLLCGFYPVSSGEYQLFGRKFSTWDLEAARANMALVSQNVFLFPTTIYENVRYGKLEASEEEIIEACKNARIHEFIMSLPEGYDTMVGERGVLLSGGERQRLSIARAFLKDAPILLLDEPTSAVDVQTEELIQDAIGRLSLNRTCITIAHRLSTVQKVDTIMVLYQGAVVESGNHEELISKQGFYEGMYGRETTIDHSTTDESEVPVS